MKTQTKEIRLTDVIHLYVGQKILSYWGDMQEIEAIVGVVGPIVILKIKDDEIKDSVDLSFGTEKGKQPKLVLRSLSDLTKLELEKEGFTSHIDWLTNEKCDPMKAPYEMVNFLIKEGYDVFGLIESGQAVDVKSVTNYRG